MYILDLLVTPILEELNLKFGGYMAWTREDQEEARNAPFARPILDFVERSNCHATLHSFHLYDRQIPAPEELVSVLTRLKYLTDLTLERLFIDYGAVFSSLCDASVASTCFPHLRRLSLFHFGPTAAPALKSLSDFLRLPRLCPCNLNVLFFGPSRPLVIRRRKDRRGNLTDDSRAKADADEEDGENSDGDSGNESDIESVTDNAGVPDQEAHGGDSDADGDRNVNAGSHSSSDSREECVTGPGKGTIGSSHETGSGAASSADWTGSEAGGNSTTSETDPGQTGIEECEGDSDDGISIDSGDVSEPDYVKSSWTPADIESSKSLLQKAHGASVTVLARRESFAFDGTWWKYYFQADNIA